MTTKKLPALDKSAFDIISLSQNDSDQKRYWQNQSITDRMSALELMRQLIYGYDPTTARLQRFFEVATRT